MPQFSSPEAVKEWYRRYLKREAENDQVTQERDLVSFLEGAVQEVWGKAADSQNTINELKTQIDGLNAIIKEIDERSDAKNSEFEADMAQIRTEYEERIQTIINNANEALTALRAEIDELKNRPVVDTAGFTFLGFKITVRKL